MIGLGTLTQRVGIVALGRLSVTAAALATNMILSRTLQKGEYGKLQEVFVHIQIAINIAAAGIQTSLYNFLPRLGKAKQKTFITQSIFFVACVAGTFAVGCYVGAEAIAHWLHEPDAASLIRFGAGALFVSALATIADPLFIVAGRADLSALAACLTAIVHVVLVGVFVRSSDTLSLFFLIFAAGQALRLLWSLGLTLARLGTPHWLTFSPSLARQQLAFLFPVALVAVLDTVSSYLDRVLVARFFDAASMATYVNGAVELPFLGILMGAVTPVLLPHLAKLLSEGKLDDVHRVWTRAVRKGAVILFGLFWLFLWISEEFIVLLFSERYRESALFFRIYLCLLPFRAIAFQPLLFALGRPGTVFVGAAADVLLNLVLSIVLIRNTSLGMAGAAWGTVIATMCQCAYYLIVIRQEMKCAWRGLLPWSALASDMLVAGAWMAPVAFAKLAGFGAIPLFLFALLLGGSYIGFVVYPTLKDHRKAA